MKKLLLTFFILPCLIIALFGCTYFEEDTVEYEIVIEDVVKVYEGSTAWLRPHLINSAGDVVEARFVYTSSSTDVVITQDGEIKINKVPSEDVEVTILERNTSTEKKIKISVVGELTSIDGVTKFDGELIEGVQNVVIGDTYKINVVSKLQNFDVQNYCTIKILDGGKQINVFDISFDGEVISLKAVGLGNVKANLSLKALSGEELYNKDIDFNLQMSDPVLSSQILAGESRNAMSKNDLAGIETVVLSDGITNVSQLGFLTSLETVVLNSDSVMQLGGIVSRYIYRVKADLLEDYSVNSAWADVFERIIPYEQLYTDRYVVYRSDKDDLVSYEKISDDFTLKSMTFPGYTHVGWKYSDRVSVIANDIKSIAKNGIHIFAIWEANDNKIVFNANTGNGQMSNVTLETDDTMTLPECLFVKAGYTFTGWSLTATGTAAFADKAEFTSGPDAQTVLYAVWTPNENTLSFNANGGSGEMTPIRANTDEIITLPNNVMKRPGYTFAGWSHTATGSVEYTDASSFTMLSSDSVILYAVWAANENTLVFSGNNGSEDVSITKKTDEEFKLPVNTFVRPGYTFIGWSEQISGAVKYEDGDDFVMPSDSTVTLWAVWEINTNTLVFNYNAPEGSVVGAMSDMSAVTGATIELNTNQFVRKDYEFLGWSTTPDGDVVYVDGDFYTVGTDSQYVLYAIWRMYDSYTITYELQYGVNNPDNVSEYRFDDEIIFYAPTRDGYGFINWCTGDPQDPASMTPITSISKGSVGDVTVYAVWTPNKNTIRFDANGGEGVTDSMLVDTDVTVELRENGFTRRGYTFAGWSTSAQSDVIEYFDKAEYLMGTSNEYTLYAVWTKNVYSITYVVGQANRNDANPEKYSVDTETIALEPLTLSGYDFAGWYSDAEYESLVENIPQGSIGNITLYAKWDAKTNVVHFNANGGAGTMADTFAKTNATTVLPANNFSKIGYSFIGWSDSPTGNILASDAGSYLMGTDNEYTLYAVWTIDKYYIIYESNGATYNPNNATAYDWETPTTFENPTKDGYTFDGWYTAPTYASSEKIESTAGKVGNLTLYAKWEANLNKLKFDANGGNGSMESIEIRTNAENILPTNTFSKGTEKFAGWSLSPTGAAIYGDGAAYKMGTAAEYTLYAVWTSTDYTIQYHLNGGTNDKNNPNGYNSAYGVTFNDPTRTGYIFRGWYTDSQFRRQIMGITAGSSGNVTVYAKWDPIEIKTIFKTDSPTGVYVHYSTTSYFDAKYTLPEDPKRTGYTFLGWYYGDKPITDTTVITSTAKEQVIEAKWDANKYIISFPKINGVTYSSKTITYSDKNPLSVYGTLPTPTMDGYEFKGWYYKGKKIEATTMIAAENHTLSSSWAAKSISVVFNYDGGTGSSSSSTVTFDDTYGTLPTATKQYHDFVGWYYNGELITANSVVKISTTHTLVAKYTRRTHKVTISENYVDITVWNNTDNVEVSNGASVYEGTSLTVTWKKSGSGRKNHWCSHNGTYIITGDMAITSGSEPCVAQGTLITLADGTQKKVEDLLETDLVLVFDHETGEYVSAPILFIERDGFGAYSVINLEFSNGTLSRLIYEHALFDLTLNKYVYFDGYSYFAFVGHEFAILGEDGEYDRATLEKAYVTVEYTASYSLITAYHMNYFVDGFFSLPGGIDGLFNIFTYDEDLTYNEKEMQNDIETYGLYTYEDFEAYVPYEVFEYFFPAKYFKVAVGKGMITYDELLSLIEKHLSKHGLT